MAPVAVNTSSQNLRTPTGTKSGSGDDDVVIVTATVYPVKPSPSDNTVAVAPTSHDPLSASLSTTANETEPSQTVGILTNVTISPINRNQIPAPSSPQLTSLAAASGFSNDQTKPLERKDGMYSIPKAYNAYLTPAALDAIPFVVAAPNAPASTYMAPPPGDAHRHTTVTLRLPFITSITFTADLSTATTYISVPFISTHIPGPGEAVMRKRTPDMVDPTTATATLPLATATPSSQIKPPSCGEQGIFRLTVSPPIPNYTDIPP